MTSHPVARFPVSRLRGVQHMNFLLRLRIFAADDAATNQLGLPSAAHALIAVCCVLALSGCHAGAGAADPPPPAAPDARAAAASHVTLDGSQIQQVQIETLSTNAPEDSITLSAGRPMV